MKQLSVKEQQLLCDLLAKLPNIDSPSERRSLVTHLSPNVRHSIPHSENTRTDLANIVSTIGSEAYFELVDHSYPVITVVQTAQNKVKKTFLCEELQKFIESLRDRCSTLSGSGQEEYDTNTSHYPGKYNIKSDSPIQGQVIDEHVYVTMHFGDGQEDYEPPLQSSNNKSDHSQVSHPFSVISTKEDTVSTCSSLDIFQQELHIFLQDVEALQTELSSTSAAFANNITQTQCRAVNARIKSARGPINAFMPLLQNSNSLKVIAHRTELMKEMLAFDKQIKLVLEDIWQFSEYYGAKLDQPENKRQEIRNQLAVLKQWCVSTSKAVNRLQDLLDGQINDKSASTSN